MYSVERGTFAPGNRVKPVRDLIEFKNKIISSSIDQEYPLFVEEYLIDECYEHVPSHLDFHQRQRWLYWSKAYEWRYKIKLFGFKMKEDRFGFEYMFNDLLFIPTYVAYETRG